METMHLHSGYEGLSRDFERWTQKVQALDALAMHLEAACFHRRLAHEGDHALFAAGAATPGSGQHADSTDIRSLHLGPLSPRAIGPHGGELSENHCVGGKDKEPPLPQAHCSAHLPKTSDSPEQTGLG